MDGLDETSSRVGAGTAILRGLRGNCPACGEGKLFERYLKPVANCSECQADMSVLRADDGPAWLTVLLLGPILVPITYLVSMSTLPTGVTLAAAAAGIVCAVLVLLPRVKGGFMGALHANRAGGDRPEA